LHVHKELAEVKHPDSEVLVRATGYTESFVASDRVDRDRLAVCIGAVCAVRLFQLLGVVVDLVDNTRLRRYEHPVKLLSFTAFRVIAVVASTRAPFKIERRENGASSVVLKHNSAAADVLVLLDPPESDVLFAARNESGVVNWTEFEAKDVELRSVLGGNFRLLTAVDP